MELDIRLINRVHNFVRNHPKKYAPASVIFNERIKAISLISKEGKVLKTIPYETEGVRT